MTDAFIGRMKRCRGWVLLCSVALNLFLIGLVSAPYLHPQVSEQAIPGPGMMIRHMTENLSNDDAVKLKAIYNDNHAKTEANHSAFRQAMSQLRSVLEADPLDKAKLEVALEAVRVAGEQLQLGMTEMIRNAATSLSVEGRRRLMMVPRGGIIPPIDMRGGMGPGEQRMGPRHDDKDFQERLPDFERNGDRSMRGDDRPPLPPDMPLMNGISGAR